jgi:hypothetical protein
MTETATDYEHGKLYVYDATTQTFDLAASQPKPFGYVIEKSGINNGYYWISPAEYKHVEDRFRHIYTPVFAKPVIHKRPRAFLAWAIDTFGAIANLRSERLMRFVEEAIELAHAAGMTRQELNILADRTYSGERSDASARQGHVNKEIGQAQVTLEMYAESIGESSEQLAQAEWERVQTIPLEEWHRRQNAKAGLGIAAPVPDWKQDQAETSRLKPREENVPADTCPHCFTDLDGGPMPDHVRQHFAPPYRWSRKIAVTNTPRPHWICPDCGGALGHPQEVADG